MAAERTDNVVEELIQSRRALRRYGLDFLFVVNEYAMKKKTNFSMKRIKAMSLLEMIIVVVIVGILISIAVPSYQKSILRARVQEAEANLRAIYAAQKIYQAKYGNCFASLDENEINNTLHLNLERNYWDYRAANGCPGPPDTVGQADYQAGPPNIGFQAHYDGRVECYTSCIY